MHFEIYSVAPYGLALLRGILAVLFIIASIQKIQQPKLFVETVRAYKVLPQFTVRPFGYGLPWVELFLGTLLLIGWSTKPTAAITGVLYAAFTVALSVNLVRGRKHLSCGCFGVKKNHLLTRWLVLRDIGLILASGALIIWGGGSFAFETLSWEAQNFLVYRLKVYILPIVLIIVGLIVFARLFNQSLRLIYLSSKE